MTDVGTEPVDAGRRGPRRRPRRPFSDGEVAAIRADFPVLAPDGVGGHAAGLPRLRRATSQRPRSVLDAERDYLTRSNAAVHRGAHTLAEEATDAYEDARAAVAAFVGRADDEVVWTRNATEGINLVALALSRPLAGDPDAAARAAAGDEVVVTEMEHHANLVPWQQACARTGATLRWLALDRRRPARPDRPRRLVGHRATRRWSRSPTPPTCSAR